MRDFSLRVMRGDRIGIVGANGAGKTTLVNLLTGALAPDSGSVRLGANVAMASLDQGRASLEPATTLVDALTGGGSDYVTINGERRHVIGYMRDFLFPPEQARTPIGKFSGGERGRLMLARALARPSNLLALDEPTNDLDIETLDLLQEMLGDYPERSLLVSHDRDFLDRVATSVIVGDGDGRWIEYAGGYSDMVAQRGYGLAGPLVAPVEAAEKPRDKRLTVERAAPKRKLKFNEKRALEALPTRSKSPRRPRGARGSSPTPTSPFASRRFRRRDQGLRRIARRAGRRGGRVARARDPARGARAAIRPRDARRYSAPPSFIMTISETIRAAATSRVTLACSPSAVTPTTNAPTAPMPVQTA